MINEIKDIIQDLENISNVYDYDLVVNFYLEQLERFTSKELVSDTLKDIEKIDNGELAEMAIYQGTRNLICELENFSIDWTTHVGTLHDIIVEYEIATEDELQIAYYFNGYNADTLNHVIYFKTSYHDLIQLAVADGIGIDLSSLGVL